MTIPISHDRFQVKHAWLMLQGIALLYLSTLVFANSECGVYFAPSTIPGAGYGMFAGKDYQTSEFVSFEDIVIPVSRIYWHNANQNIHYLWDEYKWNADGFSGMEDEGDNVYEICAISGGFGAAINCRMELENVADAAEVRMSNAGLTSSSPGVGAFTPYHGRRFAAKKPIPEGMELFTSYGEEYFMERFHKYGAIPFLDDFKSADAVLARYESLKQRMLHKLNHSAMSSAFFSDVWNYINNLRSTWKESRTLHALPADESLIETIKSAGGTSMQHYNNSIRSLEWLRTHGQCMDNIRDSVSTIPHAGRGAFASRNISKGGLVAPAPLVHIPYRDILMMFATGLDGERNSSAPVHTQLLLNYCFGHSQTSLLLCPYGLLTALINHSKKHANTKIQWSENMRHPEWLDMPVESWGDVMHNGLSFDFVALRDIEEGEEILIDYGSEWERAWKEHVHRYKNQRREHYLPAFELNEMGSELIVRTVHERPYAMDQVELHCRGHYGKSRGLSFAGDSTLPCRVLRRNDGKISTTYVAEVYRIYEKKWYCYTRNVGILWDLPRDAFYFKDIPYGRDHLQPWSYRKEMQIPDDILPIVWKNR